MELGVELAETEGKRRSWATCKRCKQTMIIDLSQVENLKKATLEGIENSDVTVYSPEKSYKVGEAIFHSNWDDFGRVIGKEILSDGKKSITVEFQKAGIKKLIESLND